MNLRLSRFVETGATMTLASLTKRIRAGFAVASLLTILCLGAAAPKANAELIVRDVTVSVTGPCLDVRNADDAAFTPIDNYNCNATISQQWNFEGLQIEGIGSNNTTGLNCVWAEGTTIGSGIVLAPCSYAAPSSWTKSWYYYNHQIVSWWNSYLCLDGSGSPGTQATLQSCNSSAAQAWALRS
jgi:hypothetical protein